MLKDLYYSNKILILIIILLSIFALVSVLKWSHLYEGLTVPVIDADRYEHS
jgi:hypothetical protein